MEAEEFTREVVVKLAETILINKIVPYIANIKKKNSQIRYFDIETMFSSYMVRMYEKYSVMDVIALPNKQIPFNTLYEPLTLSGSTNLNNKIKVCINKFPKELLESHFRLIIEDTAGMGKSTISRKIFLSAIEENIAIPILIELRNLNLNNTILDEIYKQLLIEKDHEKDIITNLLSVDKFLFILDGYDEISKDNKDRVIKDIDLFKNKFNNCYFILTSRHDPSLVTFGDFQKTSICPLTMQEAESIINRYDLFNHNKIANELLRQIKSSTNKSFQEYLANPFLVSLLFKSFDYKKELPIKKSQFYGQVYEALFEAHDLSKKGYFKREKYTNLHIDEFEKVLRYFAYFTAVRSHVLYDNNSIKKYIDQAKEFLPDLGFKSSDFLKDLVETVPLFQKDGTNYKWAHKSLQDYFAAKFIWIDSKNDQDKILTKIYKNEEVYRFYNILDLYSELDPEGFDNTIVYKFTHDFLNFSNSFILKFNDLFPNENLYHYAGLAFNRTLPLCIYEVPNKIIESFKKEHNIKGKLLSKYKQKLNNYTNEKILIVKMIDSINKSSGVKVKYNAFHSNTITLLKKEKAFHIMRPGEGTTLDFFLELLNNRRSYLFEKSTKLRGEIFKLLEGLNIDNMEIVTIRDLQDLIKLKPEHIRLILYGINILRESDTILSYDNVKRKYDILNKNKNKIADKSFTNW